MQMQRLARNMIAVRPLRIFLVEDHADTLRALTRCLERCGHTVVSAPTMAEALATLPEAGCEVLISDIGLPDGDGWQLLQRLRDAGKSFPGYAIAMSGYGMDADRAKSKAAGYTQHRVKPLKSDDFEEMLKEAARTLDEERAVARTNPAV